MKKVSLLGIALLGTLMFATPTFASQTMYTTMDAKLYSEKEYTSKAWGLIAKGSTVTVDEIDGSWAFIGDYCGMKGYVNADILTDDISNLVTDENGDIVILESQYLYPENRYTDDFDLGNLSSFCCGSQEGAYVQFGNPNDILLAGFIENTIYENMLDHFTLYYCPNGGEEVVALRVHSFASDMDTNYQLGFTYENDTITFEDESIVEQLNGNLEVGIKTQNKQLFQNGVGVDATRYSDGFAYITPTNSSPISLGSTESMDAHETSTEDVEENTEALEETVKETEIAVADTESKVNTDAEEAKTVNPIVIAVVAVGALAVALGFLVAVKKKKK